VGRQVQGKFDAGWDEYRTIVHQRQLDMGIIPPGTVLSAHDPDVPVWETLSDNEKKVFARMMEVYAGFVSYTDHHFGSHRPTRLPSYVPSSRPGNAYEIEAWASRAAKRVRCSDWRRTTQIPGFGGPTQGPRSAQRRSYGADDVVSIGEPLRPMTSSAMSSCGT
jgi:hypothetical protein